MHSRTESALGDKIIIGGVQHFPGGGGQLFPGGMGGPIAYSAYKPI